MRHSFQPRLINDPFSDPGLFIPFAFERRALLFDLGDLGPLSARDLLKVSHVFVTHAHMDHFIGFDQLLRVLLARERTIHLYGPPGFFGNLEGKLAGYTWNLVDEFPFSLLIRATEVHPTQTYTRTYPCGERFRAKAEQQEDAFYRVLLKEPSFRIEGGLLDHRVPCLGLSMVEEVYVNIIPEALTELELSVGPWLTGFKKALEEDRDPRSEFAVSWKEGGRVVSERRFILGDLADSISKRSPGRKIAYITDIIGTPENLDKAAQLAWKADHLFVESGFLDSEREIARERYHLTAREAGDLAKRAGAKEFTLFHFSPRYRHREQELRDEALAAFAEGGE
jgi:ribonuclease Z